MHRLYSEIENIINNWNKLVLKIWLNPILKKFTKMRNDVLKT